MFLLSVIYDQEKPITIPVITTFPIKGEQFAKFYIIF